MSTTIITLFEFEQDLEETIEGSFDGSTEISASTKQQHRVANAVSQGATNLEGDLSVIQGFGGKLNIVCQTEATCQLSQIQFLPNMIVEGSTIIEPDVRLNSEPNLFINGAVVSGSTDLELNVSKKSFIKGTFRGSTVIESNFQSNEADFAELTIFSILAPTFEKAQTEIVAGQLLINNEVIPVKRATLNTSSSNLLTVLEIELTKPIRTQVEYDSNFKFQVKKLPGSFETIFEGNFTQENFSISYERDSLSVSIIDALFNRFNKFPIHPVIIYNNLELQINSNEYEKPVDTQGNTYEITFIQNSNLKLYDIFEYVFVDILGFEDFNSNIVNYKLTAPVQFDITQSYISVINGLIGMFNPIIFERDGIVWIVDTTQEPPDGLELREFNPSNSRVSKSVNLERIDGYEISYVSTAGEFYIPRTENDSKQLTSTLRNDYITTYWDYYNFARPNILLRSVLISQRINQISNGTTVGSSYTEFSYDSQGVLKQDKRLVDAYIPDLDNNGAITLIHVYEERNEYIYSVVRTLTNLRRNVLSSKSTKIQGLYAIDTGNPTDFNESFLQPIMEAYIAGNLSLDMTTNFGPLKTILITYKKIASGQIKAETTVTNHLLNTVEILEPQLLSGEGQLPTQTNKKVIYWNPIIEENERKILGTISVGQLNMKYALELVNRLLKRQHDKKGEISVYETGFDLTKIIGSLFLTKERSNVILGTGIISGVRISFDFNPNAPNVNTVYSIEEL